MIVTGSALALGAVQVTATLLLAFALLALFVWAMWSGGVASVPPKAAIVLAALGVFCWLQALPLPSGLLRALAPDNLEVWSGAYALAKQPLPGFLPISLDPSASMIEGTKWLSYALAFVLAASFGRRGRAELGPALVFGSAVVVAIVTVGHRLAGATSVFGIYVPIGEFAKASVGPLLNPNNLAGYMNLGLLAGLGLMLERELAVPKWVVGVGVVLLFGVALETGSRGGLAALAVGIAAFVLILRFGGSRYGLRPRLSRGAVLGAVAALLGGALVASLAITQRTRHQLDDTSVDKLAMVSWVRPMIAEHPWLGVGRGAFESAFQRYRIGQNNLIYSHAENFPVQWVAEWGLPVAALGLGALAWLLRPRGLGMHRSAVAVGAWVGLLTLALQNLVDLGLEVPAIALAAVVCAASCVGHASAEVPASRRLRVGMAGGAVLAGALLLSASVFARESLGQARLRLEAGLEALQPKVDTERSVLRAQIMAAQLRRPADPYFPRLGAVLALRSGAESPLPWLDRSLELGLASGRTHYLLARTLGTWRKTEQALLEFRLALRYDPALAEPVAEALLQLTRDPQELARATPQGPAAARVLLLMAKRLKGAEDASLRVALLRLATKRAPDEAEARLLLGKQLLQQLAATETSSLCSAESRVACIDELRDHAAALRRLRPNAFEGMELEARMDMALGEGRRAAQRLLELCGRLEKRRPCWLLALTATLQARDTVEATRVARAAVGEGCESSDDCGKLHSAVGDTLANAGEYALAAGYLQQAAREDGTDARWLRLADIASKAGQPGLAVEALSRVQRRRKDPKLAARIAAEQARALLPTIPVPSANGLK